MKLIKTIELELPNGITEELFKRPLNLDVNYSNDFDWFLYHKNDFDFPINVKITIKRVDK